MLRRNPTRLLAGVVPCLGAALGLAGCLGLGGDAVTIRYFSPAEIESDEAPRAARGTTLRLRRVDASAHLRERLVWRSSSVEYGYYELSRWTDLPAEYLRRDLARELFERRGAARSDALDVPMLDVELIAFEELVQPHEAHVALTLRLSVRGRAP